MQLNNCAMASGAAVVALQRAMLAPSTRGPKASRLATFELLCGEGPIYPLTSDKIVLVSAKLRAAGYRTADKYLGEGKARHVELGHVWSGELQLTMRRCLLARAARGLGPRRGRAKSVCT